MGEESRAQQPRDSELPPPAALERWADSQPDPDFVERLRARFLAGEAGLDANVRTGKLDEDQLEAEIAPALDRWSTPSLRPEFVHELRGRFLAQASPARRVGQRRSAASAKRSPKPFARVGWTLAATAAAALVLIVLWRRDGAAAPPGWIARGALPEHLLVDARQFSSAAIPTHFEALETFEHGIALTFGELLHLELGPHTQLRLESFGEEGPLRLVSSAGSFRLATGPRFPGRELQFRTPDAEVRVVGTIFGIDVYPGQGTCICCIESEVHVRALQSPAEERLVSAGGMDFVDSTGVHSCGEILENHAVGLRALQQFWR